MGIGSLLPEEGEEFKEEAPLHGWGIGLPTQCENLLLWKFKSLLKTIPACINISGSSSIQRRSKYVNDIHCLAIFLFVSYETDVEQRDWKEAKSSQQNTQI